MERTGTSQLKGDIMLFLPPPLQFVTLEHVKGLER